MRFLFVTVEGGGNVPPVLGLAARLVHRGHEVHVLADPCLRGPVERAGAAFTAFTRHFVREDPREDLVGDSAARTPFGALRLTFDRVIFGPAPIVADETRHLLRRERFDAVAADVMMPGALVAAEDAGLPRAVLFHMPEYLPGRGRPAGGPGLLPRHDVLGRLRDRLLAGVFYRFVGGYVPAFNALRRDFGLPAFAGGRELIEGLFHAADRRLILTTEAFDFPMNPAPANVRYVGPVLDDPAWTGEWHDPWPRSDARPLVVISFSTTFQNQRAALQRAIDAVGRLTDVRGLVTLGPAMAGNAFTLPGNVRVVAGAPHTELFPRAAAVVTHAGHGTIMRALAHGLPLLCLPMGRDQDDNAARVHFHGAGIRLPPSAPSPRIAAAVRRLLDEPSYRQRAARLGEAIRRDAAEERGVVELERLAGASTAGERQDFVPSRLPDERPHL